MLPLSRRATAIIADWTSPRGLRGLAIFRIVTGVALLYQALINYAHRHFIWGPDGMLAFDDWADALHPLDANVFAHSGSVGWFELVYHATIVATLLWTLGVAPRVMTVIVWLLTWSLHNRNPDVLTGGNNLAQILLFYAMFADLSGRRQVARDREPWWRPYAGLLHNTAYLAVVLQVCLVYFSAGIWKLHGDRWFFGSALYYALRTPEFNLPGLSSLVYENAAAVAIFSYATWMFQIAFPFAIFMRRGVRIAVLVVALAFHCGIAAVMGLPVFALLMIGADLALLSDADYAWLIEVFGDRGGTALDQPSHEVALRA